MLPGDRSGQRFAALVERLDLEGERACGAGEFRAMHAKDEG